MQELLNNGEERIARARRGDRRALDALLDDQRAPLSGFCRRFLGSEADAQDAVQETLARAARHFGTFRGGIEWRTWLFRIAVNVCRNLVERRGTEDRRLFPLPENEDAADLPGPAADDPGKIVEARLLLEALRGRLDARSWRILMLSRGEGMTSPEIARLLGMTDGRVRQLLLRAVAAGDALWEEWNPSARSATLRRRRGRAG